MLHVAAPNASPPDELLLIIVLCHQRPFGFLTNLHFTAGAQAAVGVRTLASISASGGWPVQCQQPYAVTSLPRNMRSQSTPMVASTLDTSTSDSEGSSQASPRAHEPITVPGAPIEPAGQWLFNHMRPGDRHYVRA